MIANDFYRFRFLSIDYSGIQLHPELQRRHFERVGNLNPENLTAYKPGQYQSSEKDFKPGFKKEILMFFKELLKYTVVNVWSFDSQLQLNSQ